MAEVSSRVGDAAKRAAPPFTFGRAMFAVVAGFLVANLLGLATAEVARSIVHVEPGAKVPSVIVPSMLATHGGLLLIALLVPLTAARPVRTALGLHSAPLPVLIAAAVGTVSLGPVGDRLMTLLSELFPSLTLGIVPALHDLARSLPLWLLWPTFALLPGVAEELLFRGVLQRSISNWRVGVVVGGGAFALFHVDPVHVVGVLPLGLFLSWAAARSCTTVSVFAHVANNSIAVLSLQHADLDVGYGSDTALPTEWLIGSLLLFALAAYALARMTRDPSAPDGATRPSTAL